MVAFRPVQVTPRVASAASTSTNSRRSTTLIRSCRVLFVVVVEHRHGLLRQDRPGVGARVDQMHGAAGDLDAVRRARRVPRARRGRRAAAPDGCSPSRPWKRERNCGPRIFMNPADTTRSGSCCGGRLGERGVPGGAVGVIAQPHRVASASTPPRRSAAAGQSRSSADGHHPRRVVADGGLQQRVRSSEPVSGRQHHQRAPAHSGAHGAVAARLDSRSAASSIARLSGRVRVVVGDEVLLAGRSSDQHAGSCTARLPAERRPGDRLDAVARRLSSTRLEFGSASTGVELEASVIGVVQPPYRVLVLGFGLERGRRRPA